MPICDKCGNVLLRKHEDTDELGKPIVWYRCKEGHWKSMPKADDKMLIHRGESTDG